MPDKVWAMNRCAQCDYEVRISVSPEWVKRVESAKSVLCNVCFKGSRWERA